MCKYVCVYIRNMGTCIYIDICTCEGVESYVFSFCMYIVLVYSLVCILTYLIRMLLLKQSRRSKE